MHFTFAFLACDKNGIPIALKMSLSYLEIGRKQSQCTHLYFSAFGCDKQSIDWAIYAVGITKGVKTVIEQNLTEIFIGWFLIPIVTGLIAAALYIAVHMKYIPEF